VDAERDLVEVKICDYVGSHKNKRWQPYAAATAVTYAKERLYIILEQEIVAMAKAVNAIRGSDKRSVDSLEDPSLQLYCEAENLIFNSNSGLQIRTPSSLRQQY
jgi:hypothetical protein